MAAGSRSGLMSMSRRDADGLYAAMRDSNRYIKSARDSSSSSSKKSAMSIGKEALEVGAGALGVGWLAGRLGTTSIGNTGIPLGLTAAVAGHALAYFNVFGKFSDDIHNVSNGALAGWLAMWGAGQGTNSRQKAGLPIGPIVSGERGNAPVAQLQAPRPQMPLTEAELQAIAARNMRVAA